MHNIVGVITLAVILLISGCTGIHETGIPTSRQELVKVSPLPPLVSLASARGVKLGVLFRVLHDGTVAEVHILKSGADPDWNSAAVALMKQWRFSRIVDDTATEGHWIHYLFDVRVREPIVMTLGEIMCSRRQVADSLYMVLNTSGAFDVLSMQMVIGSYGDSGRFLGAVDIGTYPERVRNELRTLREHDFTRPIRLGDSYVIYFRFPDDVAGRIVQ